MKKYLLVEPAFPIPTKSKNHKDFLPIGLLKIGSYLKNEGHLVKLVSGNINYDEIGFYPDEIWITSLFTYWSKYVTDTVSHYKKIFPESKIIVGGIFASLFPKEEVKRITKCDDVFQGIFNDAEKFLPDYSLLENNNIDYQIIHTSRGCLRKCSFCGTWKIEKDFVEKNSILKEIFKPKIVFYDNNLLQNKYIENILNELIELKNKRKLIWSESQSGFDVRILVKNPKLGRLLKKSGFRYPRIAWDNSFEDYKIIKEGIDILIDSGYKSKEIFIFVLYNWDITFEEMEKKRKKCWEWQVQIADCRYRPLNQLYDNYNGHLIQTNKDYYIHEKAGWTDELVKLFRKNIRQQNICIRHGFPFYSRDLENKKISKDIIKKIKNFESIEDKANYLNLKNIKYWLP